MRGSAQMQTRILLRSTTDCRSIVGIFVTDGESDCEGATASTLGHFPASSTSAQPLPVTAGLRVDPDIVFDLFGCWLQIKINSRIVRCCLHVDARFYCAVEDDTGCIHPPMTIECGNNDRERRSWS